MSEAKQKFIHTIYQKVNDVLGNDNQLFMMEFPARGLNPADFEYSTEHRTSAVTKPFSVMEKEFRLSDDLYNVGRITGGPTGEKLSTVYETIINNYVPKLDSYVAFAKDKVLARRWLTEEVEFTQMDGTKAKQSRIAFCEHLMDRYLSAKLDWEKEKQQKYKELKDNAAATDGGDKAKAAAMNDAMDEYAKWIGSMGLVKDEKLNQLYNDVVVRGNLHEVMTFLGFLNASTTAEAIESTKQFMRNSVRLATDGASKVYPVQFSPSNWFQALRPNFSPKDLTMSKEALAAQYKSKSKTLMDLKQQKAEWETMTVSKEEIDAVSRKIVEIESESRKLELDFLKSQSEATLRAAKMAYNAYTAKLGNGGNDEKKKTEAKEVFEENLNSLKADDGKGLNVDTILKEMVNINGALDKTLEAKSQLSGLMAKEALLKSHNFQSQLQKINAQIEIITADMQYLEPLVQGAISLYEREATLAAESESAKGNQDEWILKKLKARFRNDKDLQKLNATGLSTYSEVQKDAKYYDIYEELKKGYNEVGEIADKPLLPDQDMNVSDLSFTDIIISSSDVTKATTQSSQASSSNSSYKVGGWFTNFNYSNSQSSAQSEFESTALSNEFECGFRIAKVTIDRGGWFNPSILKMSNSFFKLSDINGGGGITMKDIKEETYMDKAKRSLLPSYPVAFVIAKDITFKLSNKETVQKTTNKNNKSESSIGGGFGPFSASSVSSNSSASETAYSGVHGSSLYIRIPGPQILGWYMQLTPEDKSTPYLAQSNQKGEGVLDILTLTDELLLAEIKMKRKEFETIVPAAIVSKEQKTIQ